jgi:hypothetical protein
MRELAVNIGRFVQHERAQEFLLPSHPKIDIHLCVIKIEVSFVRLYGLGQCVHMCVGEGPVGEEEMSDVGAHADGGDLLGHASNDRVDEEVGILTFCWRWIKISSWAIFS